MTEKPTSRREFLKTTGLTFGFTVAGVSMQLTPAQARQQNAAFQTLNTSQASALQILADAIVPGAKEAGIAHFVDSQLTTEPEQSLLMIRYLGVPAPYRNFYLPCLDSVEAGAKQLYQKKIEQLSASELDKLVDKVAQDGIDSWAGPPASFFYFVLRSDAVDVVYGTESGFAELGIPDMHHIQPPSPW